jgi:diguanylate cyclase (GGDEF)-like protein
MSKSASFLLAVVLCGIVTLADYSTGYAVSFVLLYFFPILLVTWNVGRTAGIVFAMITSAAWFSVQFLTRPTYVTVEILCWNSVTRVTIFTAFALILSHLKKAKEDAFLSRIDHLTGARNTRAFHEEASREAERSRRHKHPLTVAYIDLDDFKKVNDTQGHSAGDDVLCTVVRTITDNTRESDLLGRVGGDEFVILFPETDYSDAQKVLQKLGKALLSAMQKGSWPVTFSIGAATFPIPPESVDGVVKLADALMYEAKRSGKNKIIHETIFSAQAPAPIPQVSTAKDSP